MDSCTNNFIYNGRLSDSDRLVLEKKPGDLIELALVRTKGLVKIAKEEINSETLQTHSHYSHDVMNLLLKLVRSYKVELYKNGELSVQKKDNLFYILNNQYETLVQSVEDELPQDEQINFSNLELAEKAVQNCQIQNR